MEYNHTNNSESISKLVSSNCNNWYDSNEGSSVMMLTQSIILDLISGIISCTYVYQFYQGIEISHPIYAILFSNIIFSTVASFLSFVFILSMFINLLPCDKAMRLNGFGCFVTILLNIISWLTIACIRHHLMTTDENVIIDLPRVRRITLSVTWFVFIIAIAVRVVLFFVVSPVFDTLSLNMIVALFFYAFFLGSFCVVSYHTDAILEERLQKKMDQEGDTLTKPPKSSGVTRSGQNLDCKAREYGGVYIGDEYNTETQCHSKKKTSNSPSTSNDNEQLQNKDKDDGKNNVVAGVARQAQENSAINHMLENDYESIFEVSHNHDIVINLPHQTENCFEANLNQPHGSQSTEAILNEEPNYMNSESTSVMPRNNVSGITKGKTIKVEGNPSMDEHDPNRIDVLQESPKTSTQESGIPDYLFGNLREESKNEVDSSKNDKVYKDTKEHKSIIKAVMFNIICSAIFISILIVVRIIDYYPNIYLIIIFNGIVKFQRTFGILIASVYCFEVVQQLFRETLYDLKSWFDQLYSRFI